MAHNLCKQGTLSAASPEGFFSLQSRVYRAILQIELVRLTEGKNE